MQDSGTITVDPRLQAKIDGLIDELTPAARAVLDEEVGAIYSEARRQWPIKTGESKAALKFSVRVVGDKIVASISNDVEYTKYIRTSRRRGLLSRAVPVWNSLVIRPGRRHAERIALQVAEAFAEDAR